MVPLDPKDQHTTSTHHLNTEVTGLDLSELDRWWYHLKRGESNGYHGLAVSPIHLSPVERWIMKYDRNFDLKKDASQRAVCSGCTMTCVDDVFLRASTDVYIGCYTGIVSHAVYYITLCMTLVTPVMLCTGGGAQRWTRAWPLNVDCTAQPSAKLWSPRPFQFGAGL